jgi:hypothetical protein
MEREAVVPRFRKYSGVNQRKRRFADGATWHDMGSLELSPIDSFSKLATSTILFYLNGSRIELNGNTIDPDATLLDFIRSQGPGLTGTKLGCGEGGCGACTIVYQSRHPVTRAMQ